MHDLPFQTITQFAALGLTLVLFALPALPAALPARAAVEAQGLPVGPHAGIGQGTVEIGAFAAQHVQRGRTVGRDHRAQDAVVVE